MCTPFGIDGVTTPRWPLLRDPLLRLRRSDVPEKASICLFVCWSIVREYDPISVGGGGEFAMLTEKESSWDDILSKGICVVVNVDGVYR